ncbi:MAG: hypothetical protein KDD47_20095, partial [Acidobacteria bacterium]|nr:hypothetical protein [Acidobacteriota bacterium]
TFARSWWPVLALLALAGAAYRGVWDLGFASEDFLILGHLHQRPLTEVLLEELKGPWLGLSFVSFYRPISTVLLALELRLWGLDPTPFHLAHLLLHGVNSCLVWSIARRLIPSSAALPLAAGALFAVSPLHPSAVAFVGSYATIFGGFFSLLALATYLASRSSRRKGPYAVALAASALALGSYEGAVALPVVLAMASLLLHGQALAVEPARRWQRSLEALRPAVPFFLLLAAYFFLRRAVLGVLVGGYGVFRERLLSHFLDLLGDFLASLPLLIVPDLHRLPSLVGEALVGALLAVSSLAFFLLGRRRQPLAAVALAALVWTFVFELPISFVRVLPATGRFWYLASFSATLMGLTLLAGALSAVRSRRPSKLTANFVGGGALGALLLLQLGWLRSDLALYRLADL